MSNLERAVKDLQDNLVVISEIERRQSELLKVHSERLVLIEAESAEYRRRTDLSLAHAATNSAIFPINALHRRRDRTSSFLRAWGDSAPPDI